MGARPPDGAFPRRVRTILSIGFGRLHLMQSAQYLAAIDDIAIRLVCGWVPRRPTSVVVRFCSRIMGRDLSFGMSKRKECPAGVTMHNCAGAEFVVNGLFLLSRRGVGEHFRMAVIGWKLFGWCSRRYIKDAAVFHVRSGAGQGGAIRKAKQRGMKVIVDHSMAHPGYIEQRLRPIYDAHGELLILGSSNPFFRLVLKDCQEADLVLVNSEFVRDTFVAMGYQGTRIRVVPQGVRRDFFGLRHGRAGTMEHSLRLLFTGNFCFHKGASVIMEALKLLKDQGIEGITMDVVGTYSSATKLIEEYRSYELPLIFHGHVPQDRLKEFLAEADVYVFPSLAEGCASSGMEAMAAGLCVVATHESGLPIVDDETGYLIPVMDAISLAKRLEWLLRHPDDVERVGRAASRLIQGQYTWEHYAQGVSAIYRELVSTSQDHDAGS